MSRNLKDHLRDQFCRLEKGSMIVVEHEGHFYEIVRHSTLILDTEYERVVCFF